MEEQRYLRIFLKISSFVASHFCSVRCVLSFQARISSTKESKRDEFDDTNQVKKNKLRDFTMTENHDKKTKGFWFEF
jgi:hypothetical protein